MNWLLLPPIAFAVVLGIALILSAVFSRLSMRPANVTADATKPYACGEDFKTQPAQPEYAQFFPFAFFFTIMHVVALIVATAPAGSLQIAGLAVLYLLAAVMALFILFRS